MLEQSVGFATPFLYTGEYRDDSLGWDYLRARYSNAESGRFVSRDSFGGFTNDPLSIHKYLYTKNDPLNHVDPSGNVSAGSVLIGVSIIAMLALNYFGNDVVNTIGGLAFTAVSGYYRDVDFAVNLDAAAKKPYLEVRVNSSLDGLVGIGEYKELLERGRAGIKRGGPAKDEYEAIVEELQKYRLAAAEDDRSKSARTSALRSFAPISSRR